MARNRARIVICALELALLLGFCAVSHAQSAAGRVTHLSGIMSAVRADGQSRLLSVQSEVFEGETLSTEKDAYARIKFVDDAEVTLRPQSQLKLGTYRYNATRPEGDSVVLNMLRGGLRAITGLIGHRNRERVSVQSSVATIGIRGTTFDAQLCSSDCANFSTGDNRTPPDGLHVSVVNGVVVVSNGAGTLLLPVGQSGFVGSAQQAPQLVPPENGVRFLPPPVNSSNGVNRNQDPECVAQ